MKVASIFQRGEKVFVHAMSRATTGVWVFQAPCIELLSDCADQELGDAVFSSLDASVEGVPHPVPFQGEPKTQPLLLAAGVKSWNAFAKSAKHVRVEQYGQAMTFVPMINLSPKKGFIEKPENSVCVTVESKVQTAAQIRKLLASL